MNNTSFRLTIVTPTKIVERDITHIRLKDETAYFGIMKGHIDFLTVLVPSLCYHRDASGKETFLAVDGGILSVRGGAVTLTSREVYEGDDAERLAEIIEGTIAKRQESERALISMLKSIERSFIEKAVDLTR
ncbi:MAG: F0F1 ATP synthase subunit epsilon [Betaproteobacteria bacterium]